MRSATLVRTDSSDEGTFGDLILDDGWMCKTGELPWRDNQADESCIPDGIYECKWTRSNRLSKKKGEDVFTYEILNVPGRGGIRIHAANFVGDDSKVNPATGVPYHCELKGCISPGKAMGRMNKQMAVLQSGVALSELVERLNKEPFMLTIKEVKE